MPHGDYLTSAEAAREFPSYSSESYRRFAREGKIPALKVGRRGHYRFRRDVLEAFTLTSRDEGRA